MAPTAREERKGRGGDRLQLLRSCGWLACGSFALVAWLNAANRAVSPLSPMLASPWLSIHVTIMMISYALLVMCSATALAALLTILMTYFGVNYLPSIHAYTR